MRHCRRLTLFSWLAATQRVNRQLMWREYGRSPGKTEYLFLPKYCLFLETCAFFKDKIPFFISEHGIHNTIPTHTAPLFSKEQPDKKGSSPNFGEHNGKEAALAGGIAG